LTHKIKIGTANRWESTNSKPPGPIIIVDQSETRKAVKLYLSYSAVAFTFLGKNARPKSFY
jgi:hypothetical protein